MTEKGSRRLVDEKGVFDMGKDAMNDLEIAQGPNLDEIDDFDLFKAMYLDWLRFFRENMNCEWACRTCPLPDDCPEIDRVWKLWLDSLQAEWRAAFN